MTEEDALLTILLWVNADISFIWRPPNLVKMSAPLDIHTAHIEPNLNDSIAALRLNRKK